jgi:hypothetical protein
MIFMDNWYLDEEIVDKDFDSELDESINIPEELDEFID